MPPTGRRAAPARRRARRARRSRRGARRGPSRAYREVLVWSLIGLSTFVLGGYAALVLFAGDKVADGTTVDGVPIGGLTAAAARTRLETVLGPRQTAPIKISGGGVDGQIDPASVDMRLDAAGSVKRAGGGWKLLPTQVWRYYDGGTAHQAEVHVDRAKLAAAVNKLAGQVDTPVTEGDVVFRKGKPVTVQPADGQRLGRDQTATALTDGYLGTSEVRLPVKVLEPTVEAPAVRKALTDVGFPATSGPVRLTVAGQTVTATPAQYTQAISLVRKGDDLVPSLDVDRLFEVLEPVLSTVPGAPRPARFVISDGKPVVKPSRIGVTFDREDLQQKFLTAVLAPKGSRSVSVKGVRAAPTFTTADARALQVRSRVARFSSDFGYAEWRNTNLERGAELLDGTLVLPGRTFSFDDTIGAPTGRRGFVSGLSRVGAVFTPDPGGGLSQLASTLDNAVLLAGRKRVEATLASVRDEALPLGREVSVRHGSRDYRFANDSSYGLLVTASVSPVPIDGRGRVTVELWSTKQWKVGLRASARYGRVPSKVRVSTKADCSATVGAPGYKVNVVRTLTPAGPGAAGEKARRDVLTTVYPAADSLICAAPG